MNTSRHVLARFGWDSRWEEAFAAVARPGQVPARIILAHTHIYTVAMELGERLARVSGRFRHVAQERHEFPVVGDWAACREETGGRVRIEELLPRRTRFSRKVPGVITEEQVVAANIDTVFVVMGCDSDFNLRRLERYLVLARDSGADSIVLLNKADKATDPQALKHEIEVTFQDLPVHLLSAKTGAGFDELESDLHSGQTIALLGSSGVGKSTIVNRLAGTALLRTGEVREQDERGRHTTRHRQLVLLPNGSMLIDSPGMRELQLWDASEGFSAAFEDIEALAQVCRFRDCTHRTEPGCAVRRAVESGTMPAGRLDSYVKLAEERRQLEERLEEKRRGRKPRLRQADR